MSGQINIQKLSALQEGQDADVFVKFVAREQLLAKNGKPYCRVTFRDETREISFPIWENAPMFEVSASWVSGTNYKIRATYTETQFGPNLNIKRIREATENDIPDGYDPRMGIASSPFEPEEMYADIQRILRENIENPGLLELVTHIFETYRDDILTCSAAMGKHHATVGGLLEHTRNVLTTAVWLAHRYREVLPDMEPPLDLGVVAAGAALHDIGKLRELRATATGFEYTPEGNLLGHIVMGRDYVRDAATELRAKHPDFTLDFETQLRLEHTILSHQRLPEWGAPKTNMTPESLLIHYADDIDAKYYIMYHILAEATGDAEFTDNKNSMRVPIFRGL